MKEEVKKYFKKSSLTRAAKKKKKQGDDGVAVFENDLSPVSLLPSSPTFPASTRVSCISSGVFCPDDIVAGGFVGGFGVFFERQEVLRMLKEEKKKL